MFALFKRDNNLYAPAKGKCLDITECKDRTFSSKVMGDGFLILPEEDAIYSPCNGRIKTIFPTKHAIGFQMEDGKEIMLHIGIDTVKLKGEKMECHVSPDSKVRKGTLLVTFDKQYMAENDIDMSTMVIVLKSSDNAYRKMHIRENVNVMDCIVEYS